MQLQSKTKNFLPCSRGKNLLRQNLVQQLSSGAATITAPKLSSESIYRAKFFSKYLLCQANICCANKILLYQSCAMKKKKKNAVPKKVMVTMDQDPCKRKNTHSFKRTLFCLSRIFFF